METFISCKAVSGWIGPGREADMPSFTINTTTDILLNVMRMRSGQKRLPLWEAHGLGHLIPFEHEHLENWTNSMQFGQDQLFQCRP